MDRDRFGEDTGGGGLELREVIFLNPVLVNGVVGGKCEGAAGVTVDAQGTEPAGHGIGRDNLLQFKADGCPNLGQIDSWSQVTHKLFMLQRGGDKVEAKENVRL